MGVFEPHAAIERHETLAGQREIHHQHRAGLAGGAVDGVLLDLFDPGIGQQRNVEFRRLLGLAVEPQAGEIWTWMGSSLRSIPGRTG